jgi:hypothetical protein
VDRVFYTNTWSSHYNNNNNKNHKATNNSINNNNNNNHNNNISSKAHLKKRDYCDDGEVLTWNLHHREDAKHPLGAFECKSEDKKRTAFCIGNEKESFLKLT